MATRKVQEKLDMADRNRRIMMALRRGDDQADVAIREGLHQTRVSQIYRAEMKRLAETRLDDVAAIREEIDGTYRERMYKLFPKADAGDYTAIDLILKICRQRADLYQVSALPPTPPTIRFELADGLDLIAGPQPETS